MPPLITVNWRNRNINRLDIAYSGFAGLGLVPALPHVDERCVGTLGYSAWGILTPISLLIPAFLLLTAPPGFTAEIHRS